MDNKDTNNGAPLKTEKPKITGAEKKQRRIFKRRRSGAVLTRDQVKEIKQGRKKLRKEMRAQGIKSRKEFELTASSLGLYFDKPKWLLPLWFLNGKGLWALLGALLATLVAITLMSYMAQLRGHFTINMTNDMFREGFSLSDTVGFENPVAYLFGDRVFDAPCTSIAMLPKDLDDIDGSHNGDTYFAYTFYIKNEGDTTVGYDYNLFVNSESKNLTSAAWIMLFEDGEMRVFAKAGEDGSPEMLPAADDNTRGYVEAPYISAAASPEEQFETIAVNNIYTFYRIKPYPFESDTVITSGTQTGVEPQEVHKYTVVLWLEGDDPDCTNDLIGSHLGVQMSFKLVSEEFKN